MYLMYVGSHEVVQLVEDAVDNLDQQMAFLILEGGAHEEGQDLIEEGAGPELPGLVGDLAEGGLPHGGRPVLDLQQQLHDLALLLLLAAQLVLVHVSLH